LREDDEDLNGRGRSLAFDLAHEWFREFFLSMDNMPNCGTKTLPSCLTKAAVYQIYKEQMTGKPLLAKSTFIYSLWKAKFPNVIIPKVSLTRIHFSYYQKYRIVKEVNNTGRRGRLWPRTRTYYSQHYKT
jgi:hypothetical protein